jgi:para-aminobenzoate synthetase component I
MMMKKISSPSIKHSNRERIFVSYPVENFSITKLKMLNWANPFNIFCFLDNHHYPSVYHSHECLLAAGAVDFLSPNQGIAFEAVKKFSDKHQDWMFGHFGYDLKNETEDLVSENEDNIGFGNLFFFVPEIIIELSSDKINIGLLENKHQEIFNQIEKTAIVSRKVKIPATRTIQAKFSKTEYIATVEQLKKHILRGDCYEINFCQEYFIKDLLLDPLGVYIALNAISPNPFAAFYKVNDKFLACASPERYLKRDGNRVFSQPIKGTWKKNNEDEDEDLLNRTRLAQSAKDRSENVMIVDLVRNDLSRICKEGTVRVDELFGIYSYPNLHHLVSSISGELSGTLHWVDMVRATFPMGSMTGAPKKKVMQLIETYEKTRRGIFSGALGYVNPAKDFDFNVVIRTILYNQTNRYLSFSVGSGLTFYSDSEEEYAECLLKMASIKKVLTS